MTHRLATIHNVTDRETDAKVRPLVRLPKNCVDSSICYN